MYLLLLFLNVCIISLLLFVLSFEKDDGSIGTTLKGLKTERGLGLCAQIAFSEIDLTEDEVDEGPVDEDEGEGEEGAVVLSATQQLSSFATCA